MASVKHHSQCAGNQRQVTQKSQFMHQNFCRRLWMISSNVFFLCKSQAFSTHWEQSSVASCPWLRTCYSAESSLVTSLCRASAHLAEPIQTNLFFLFLAKLTSAAFALLSLAFCYLFDSALFLPSWPFQVQSFPWLYFTSCPPSTFLICLQMIALNICCCSNFSLWVPIDLHSLTTLFSPHRCTVHVLSRYICIWH